MINPNTEGLAKEVVDVVYSVHREMGPGLLESVYRKCACAELATRNLKFQEEAIVPLNYKGQPLHEGLRADIIVEGTILLELKSVEVLLPIHVAQTITYLKLTSLDLGFLINFNTVLLKNGIQRLLNPRFFSSGKTRNGQFN